jgi:CheY-like chemotaxis protein
VAHEINNPTTFIRGNLQTLGKFWDLVEPLVAEAIEKNADRKLRFVREEMPQLLRDMTAGTERISKIVSGLRSFSHQGASHTRVETSLSECVQGALDLVHNRIKNTVRVEKELPELPPLQGDPQKLTQVFVNLVVNAADAMEGRADAAIRITGRADEHTVVVEVADNGPGIPPPIRAKIFDPFFTTKSVGKGTGLGLSIILGIIQEHGGRIAVGEGREGSGAVFRIVLPRDAAAGLPEEKANERARVLVVEDDPQIRQVMEAAIGALGTYEVDSAKDGREGVERIEATRPDVVLLDIMLPGMDGFEVLQRIRSRPAIRGTKVICMTAMDMPGVRERLKTLGADALFFKPIRFGELFEALGRLTGGEAAAAPATGGDGQEAQT